jgi:hypothetical protein
MKERSLEGKIKFVEGSRGKIGNFGKLSCIFGNIQCVEGFCVKS